MGKYLKYGALLFLAALCLGLFMAWPQPTTAPEITRYAREWPLPNHDFNNTRASTSSAINSTNAANLRLVWSFPINGAEKCNTADGNPIIQAGVVYVQDHRSNLYALDLESGILKWKKDYDMSAQGPVGPALARNRIFVVKGDSEIAALDTKGNEKWSRRLSDDQRSGIKSQPVEYDGMIITSTLPSYYSDYQPGGVWGTLYALDYKTGETKWEIDTIGFDSSGPASVFGGGGGAAYPPAIDCASGRLFWTAEGLKAAPGKSLKTSANAGGFPYSNSIRALKCDTGSVIWEQRLPSQNKPNPACGLPPPILAAVDSEKGLREMVFVAGKGGSVFAVNSKSGQALWEVTLSDSDHGGIYNGTAQSPMAYHEGILYVPVAGLPKSYGADDNESELYKIGQGKGGLLAIDVRMGSIVWSRTFDGMVLGGATVVNDLVFTSTSDGEIYALQCGDGKTVWQYQAPGGIYGCPAASGTCIVFPVNAGSQPALLNFSLKS